MADKDFDDDVVDLVVKVAEAISKYTDWRISHEEGFPMFDEFAEIFQDFKEGLQ